MKQVCIILILNTLLLQMSCSQSTETFQIEKLTPPKEKLDQISLESFIKYSDVNLEKHSALPDSLIYFGENPFLSGIVTAYQDHRPFTLSPDMIWLLISQGFARHISFNPEKYRDMIVHFDGKQDLKIEARDYITLGDTNSQWEKVFPQFVDQMNSYLDSELTDVLTANFSTTTKVERIVSQITIMETMKGYFGYEVDGRGCGIPAITIEGTVEDWQKVLNKTQYLSKYDLQWWTSELCPIIENIIDAKKGKFHRNFWMNMVKIHSKNEYGSPDIITGWISTFYPYTSDGKRTNLKELSDLYELPTEYVRVPFLFADDSLQIRMKMEFRAGFLGLTQNPTDFTLKPLIGWMVCHIDPPAIKQEE